MSHLVEHFNQQGLAALLIAPGRGRKETYTPIERERVVEEFRRLPDREEDATATWSLMTLRGGAAQASPAEGRSGHHPRGAHTRAGYRFGKTRTWCPTGQAIRVRKAGTVTVHDPKAQEKKLDRASLRACGSSWHRATV